MKDKLTRTQADDLRLWQLKLYADLEKKCGSAKAAFEFLKAHTSFILACYSEGDKPEDVWEQC